MIAQLNMTEYFVDEILVAANREYAPAETKSGTIDVDFDVRRSAESLLDFMITMSIELNKSDEAFLVSDYRVILKLTGFFRFDEGIDENIINGMIHQNGLTILYGVARGVVSQATATSWHGKLILPGVNFIELIKEKAAAAMPKKQVKKPVSKKKK
jgi:preprotein translocase subunit SecB